MHQLNAHDAMFVHFDNENWAAHGGIVGIYDPSTAPGGQVRFRDILAHLQRRLPRSPVFRRRLVRVPLDLDNPYWIEDEHFDLEFHLRHLRLPHPADWRQLCITIARLDSRPLDLNRPPWEMYVIEGLDHVDGVPEGSYAIFTKLHHAAVDGHSMRDIMTAIHDLTPDIDDTATEDSWAAEPRPGSASLLDAPRSTISCAPRCAPPAPPQRCCPPRPKISRALLTRSGSGSVLLPIGGPPVPRNAVSGRGHPAPRPGRMCVRPRADQAHAVTGRRRHRQRRDRRDRRRRRATLPRRQGRNPHR